MDLCARAQSGKSGSSTAVQTRLTITAVRVVLALSGWPPARTRARASTNAAKARGIRTALYCAPVPQYDWLWERKRQASVGTVSSSRGERSATKPVIARTSSTVTTLVSGVAKSSTSRGTPRMPPFRPASSPL